MPKGAYIGFAILLVCFAGFLALVYWLRAGGEERQIAFQANAMSVILGVFVLFLLYGMFAPKKRIPLVSKWELARLERERQREAAAAAQKASAGESPAPTQDNQS